MATNPGSKRPRSSTLYERAFAFHDHGSKPLRQGITDDGSILGLNLPTVAVHDLVVKDDDLVLATHGRSMWILDDLTPIREWSNSIAGEPVHLFPARPERVQQYPAEKGGEQTGQRRFLRGECDRNGRQAARF